MKIVGGKFFKLTQEVKSIMYSTYFAFYLFTALPTASHISDLFRQKSRVSASGSLVGIRAL